MAVCSRARAAPPSSIGPLHGGGVRFKSKDYVAPAWTVEAAALATKKAIQRQSARVMPPVVGIITTSITNVEVGKATGTVAPIFAALKRAKEMVDGAKRHNTQLQVLHDRCIIITAYLIVRCNSQAAVTCCKPDAGDIDATPLEDCVEALRELAARCSLEGGALAKFGRRRRESDRINRLRNRIEALVPGMGLAAVVQVSEEEVRRMERVEQGGGGEVANKRRNFSKGQKLPAVPADAPKTKRWHIIRNVVTDGVYNHFIRDDGPWMVGLVGPGGSGKTTAAGMIVGENIGVVRPLRDESVSQALERLSRVRSLFSDGVVWLRVGKNGAERLPGLMQYLAKMVYEQVVLGSGKGGHFSAPGKSPTDPKNGAAYVRETVAAATAGGGPKGEKGLRCLLVADDVWESEVVEELRKTGMRVLLTTRNPELVSNVGAEAILLDGGLQDAEAEALLICAAELPKGARLPDTAIAVAELCGYMPMYVESVARWETLRRRNDVAAWTEAVEAIQHHTVEVQKAMDAPGGGGNKVLSNKSAGVVERMAILRAGFECLGSQDSRSRWLYQALAVLPDGYAFGVHEAAVLLFDHEHTGNDRELAGHAVATLELWAIVAVQPGTGLYRMNGALSDFARRAIMHARGFVRRDTIARWRAYLSTLEVIRSVGVVDLVALWRAVERVGGEGWRASRSYDAPLAELDISDPLYFPSAKRVAELYGMEGDYDGAAGVMQKVWERHEVNPKADPYASLAALFHCTWGALDRGHREEARHRKLRMALLLDGARERWKNQSSSTRRADAKDAAPISEQEAHFLYIVGLCCLLLRRVEEAEEWIQRALAARPNADLEGNHALVKSTRHELAKCVLGLGQVEEAEELFRQSLETTEATHGVCAMPVARTLLELARCVRSLGRVAEAEALFRRALAIKEKLGKDNLQVAYVLHELGLCVGATGRVKEAEALFRRALGINEAGLGKENLRVATTLHELALCVRNVGHVDEAESLLRRALAIREARLGTGNLRVAYTLHELARCMSDLDRAEDALSMLRQAVAIYDATVGIGMPAANYVKMAKTELAQVARRAG